jgi:hypothetical protein
MKEMLTLSIVDCSGFLIFERATKEVRAKMAKTRSGKKKVHVPAHTRTVRTKNGRRRKRIPGHYRSTPE